MRTVSKTLLLVTLGVISLAQTVFSGETSRDISFRNIPWFTSRADAEELLESEGATSKDASWKNYARRLSGIEFTNVMDGDDYVDGGGISRKYSGLTVAGYKPSSVEACYIYTVNDDMSLNRDQEKAQLYFGWYEFDSNDYIDGMAVYEDFLQKLTSVYGDGTTDDTGIYFTTTDWYDSAGNQIRLLLGGKNRDSGSYYVTLGYIAAGFDERLDEVQSILDAEAAAAEAAEREANKENVDGL